MGVLDSKEKKSLIRGLLRLSAACSFIISTVKTLKDIPETVRTIGPYVTLFLHYGSAFFGHWAFDVLACFVFSLVFLLFVTGVLWLVTLGKLDVLWPKVEHFLNRLVDPASVLVVSASCLVAAWQTFIMKSTDNLDDTSRFIGYVLLFSVTSSAVAWFIPDEDKEESKTTN